jgi:hypothetical protein
MMDLCQMPWPHGKTRVAKSFQDLGIGFTNPRIHVRPRLMELVDQAVGQGACDGKFAQIAQEIETVLREQKGHGHSDEYRRCNGGHLCRIGICPAPCTRAVLFVTLCWHFGAFLGTNEPRRAQQGTDTTALQMDL